MLKKIVPALLVAAFVAATFVAPVHAAAPKTYQVTGPVVELTADTIVVMKGKDRWEVARDANTKVTGDLKPNSGQIKLFGADITQLAPHRRARC